MVQLHVTGNWLRIILEDYILSGCSCLTSIEGIKKCTLCILNWLSRLLICKCYCILCKPLIEIFFYLSSKPNVFSWHEHCQEASKNTDSLSCKTRLAISVTLPWCWSRNRDGIWIRKFAWKRIRVSQFLCYLVIDQILSKVKILLVSKFIKWFTNELSLPYIMTRYVLSNIESFVVCWSLFQFLQCFSWHWQTGYDT